MFDCSMLEFMPLAPLSPLTVSDPRQEKNMYTWAKTHSATHASVYQGVKENKSFSPLTDYYPQFISSLEKNV